MNKTHASHIGDAAIAFSHVCPSVCRSVRANGAKTEKLCSEVI